VLRTHKPLHNLVEAHFTREIGEGLAVPTKNGFRVLDSQQKGEQESAYAQDKLALQGREWTSARHLSSPHPHCVEVPIPPHA
jgi:hypothetical protein